MLTGAWAPNNEIKCSAYKLDGTKIATYKSLTQCRAKLYLKKNSIQEVKALTNGKAKVFSRLINDYVIVKIESMPDKILTTHPI